LWTSGLMSVECAKSREVVDVPTRGGLTWRPLRRPMGHPVFRVQRQIDVFSTIGCSILWQAVRK
jgi:hypothetical protein